MTKLDYPPKTKAELEEEKQKLKKILEDATEAANKLAAKKEKRSGIIPAKTTEVLPEKEETKESAEKTVGSSLTPEVKEPEKNTEVQPEKETTPATEETLTGKEAEGLLKNIKRDDNKIQAKIKELESQGIDEELAKDIAETEDVINSCLARIDVLQKAPKIKDQEKRLRNAQDKLDTEKKNLESLINIKKQNLESKKAELTGVVAQLQEMITKLKEDGSSDEEIEKILKSKNLPDEEINKLLGKETSKPQDPEKEPETPKGSTPEPEKTKPESGNPKPAEPTPEPTKPTVTKTPENNTEELEKNLDEARVAYIDEYKKCAKEANKHKIIEQTKNSILNIFRKKENKSSVKIEDFFTDKLKELETKYKEAKVSLQNKMYLDKKEELKKTLSGEDLDKALATYKRTDILNKLVFDEKQKIIDAKTEKIATWKKIIDGYRKLPKYQRVAISTALFAIAAGTGIIGGGAITGYALASMAGTKFIKGMIAGTVVGYSAKSIDWINKRNDKVFAMQQNIEKNKFQEQYGRGEMSLEDYEKAIKQLDKEEQKRYRNRALLKAGVGVLVAGTAGYFAYDALGNGISHAENLIHGGGNHADAISGPDAGHLHNTIDQTKTPGGDITKNIIEHNDVKAVADHGQGAISTLKELQNNLRAEYGNNLDNAPASVKHILETDAHKLAEEYGMYKPGQDAESALVKSGSYFEVDKDGNLTYHDVGGKSDNLILEKGTEIKGSGVYDEKMVDTDHSGAQVEETPYVTASDTNTVPEQIDPETGEKIDVIKIQETPKVSDTNTNIINEQVNPENDGKLAGQDNTDMVRDGLTRAEIEHAHNVFNNNIDHLIGSQPRSAWQYIQNNVSAQRIMEMHRVGEVKEDFIRLTDHMDKLERITGVHPQGPEYGLGGIILKEAETIPHFIGRALEEAEKQGVIDQVTL